MSKLFKKLRKTLIEEGALANYFKYAFGEIILTILGIILALQVHTWNEHRLNVNEVEKIVGNLQDEFLQNKENLAATLDQLEASLVNAKFVIELVGKSEAELKQYNLDSLLAVSMQYKKFNPSQDVISVLIESGRLKLIENDSIRNAIYDWSSNEIELNHHFSYLDNNTSKMFNYLTQHYSLKDFDYYTSERLLGKSNLKINKFAIFQDIVFENHLDNEIYYMHSYAETLKKTAVVIDQILEYSKQYQ